MSGIALDKSSLLSVFVESVLWGLFFSLYLISIFLLVQKSSNFAKHAPYLVLASVMFLLCTMHVGLSFHRVISAFFRSPYPDLYLEDVTNSTFRFKNAVLFVQVFIGDLLIVSRSFMLWNRNYFVVIVPTLLAVGTLVAAGGALQTMSLSSHTDIIFNGQVQSWMTATWTLALATKGLCLFLVMFRVGQIHATITSNVNRHVTVYTLLVVLIESGAAAFFTTAILLPTFVAKQNAHYIVCDALSPITAITLTVIIAGMTINLSNPGPPSAASRPAWNRYSVPSPTTPSRAPKNQWNDYEDDDDAPTSDAVCPVLSRTASMQVVNKSSGTLNSAIVI